MRSSRREILQYLALACGLELSVLGDAAGERKPSLEFPSQPRERLSVTSYPFRAYIESPTNRGRTHAEPRMDMLDFPGMVAEKFGVHNVNPLIDHFRAQDEAYFAQFREAVAKARSHVVDLGLPGRQWYSPDRARRTSAVSDGRKWIDMAVSIGSPSVRQHVQTSSGQKPDVALAAASLGEMAAYGAKHNVVVNLENDNPVAEDPFFLVAVIEKVNNPYLRGLPDFGNSLIGHDADYNRKAVAGMLAHAFNMCHVKDTVESDSGKKSQVDLKTMFRLAQDASYRGYFSMECEANGNDPFAGTQKLVSETLEYLT